MGAPVWINRPEVTETAPPADFAAAQPDLLRRVLDGLRKRALARLTRLRSRITSSSRICGSGASRTRRIM